MQASGIGVDDVIPFATGIRLHGPNLDLGQTLFQTGHYVRESRKLARIIGTFQIERKVCMQRISGVLKDQARAPTAQSLDFEARTCKANLGYPHTHTHAPPCL